MTKRTFKPRGKPNKRLSETVLRFTCSTDDRLILEQAAEYDKRKLADFLRVYTLRVANQLVAQMNGIDLMKQVGGFMGTQKMHPDLFRELLSQGEKDDKD